MERQQDQLKLKLGEKAPYFSLRGTDGKIYSLADFQGAKALAIIFTCNHCPYAKAYEGRIINLAQRYKENGVRFVAICSNDPLGYPEDNFENMVTKTKALQLPYPYLHDEEQITAKAYDAACTPEAYLFDEELKLRYHGRIDDNYQSPEAVEQHNLADAIEAVIKNLSPETQLTPAIGCSIKWRK